MGLILKRSWNLHNIRQWCPRSGKAEVEKHGSSYHHVDVRLRLHARLSADSSYDKKPQTLKECSADQNRTATEVLQEHHSQEADWKRDRRVDETVCEGFVPQTLPNIEDTIFQRSASIERKFSVTTYVPYWLLNP